MIYPLVCKQMLISLKIVVMFMVVIFKSCEFKFGDSVKVSYMIGQASGFFSTVVKCIGLLRYLVRIGFRVRFCHLNHFQMVPKLTIKTNYELNHPQNPDIIRQDLSQEPLAKPVYQQ